MDKTKIKWIALAIAVVLAFTGIGIAIGLAIQISNPDAALSLFNADVLDYQIFNDEGHITLSLAAAGDQDSYTKTITATVLPSDAPNKSVRWSVVWDAATDAPSDDGVVSHYITVTPSSNDSKVATIQCLKPFEGYNVLVQCRTDVGGYMATCVVKYVGTPNSLSINTNGYTPKTIQGWNVSGVEVACGTTATLSLSLDNAMHAVGSSYGTYVISGVAHGGVTFHTVTTSNYGGGTSESDGTKEMTVEHVSSLYDQPVECVRATLFKDGAGSSLMIADIFVENGQLRIEAKDSFSAYSYSGGDRASTIKRTFTGYIDGKKPYIELTVTEVNSGVSQKINITTQASVTSLSLSSTNIEF